MLQRSLLLAVLALLGTACKGATNGKPPVDHPIYAYQPPEEAEADDAEDEDAEETDEEGEE